MKQHPIYQHLYVTQDGQVFSNKTHKFLKTHIHKNGYRVFCTRLGGRSSPAILLRVHRLVCETYLDNPNNYPIVNHLDGNKLNNNLSNLEWTTHSGNVRHAFANGLKVNKRGAESHTAKLTQEQRDQIKERYTPYNRINGSRALAREFGVSHSTVLEVVREGELESPHPKGNAF